MSFFDSLLDTMAPGEREGLSDDQVQELLQMFMNEVMANEVIMGELEQKLLPEIAKQRNLNR